MKYDSEEIGKRIREIREFLGYTRENLSISSQISTKYLYEIEMGKCDFSAAILYRISNKLGVSINCIICGIYDDNYKNEKIVKDYLKLLKLKEDNKF